MLEHGVDAQHHEIVDRLGDLVQAAAPAGSQWTTQPGHSIWKACSTTMRARRLSSVIGWSVLNQRSTTSGGARGRVASVIDVRLSTKNKDPSLRSG